MDAQQTNQVIAFNGHARIASGTLADVAVAAKRVLDTDKTASVLIFDVATSRMVEVDFRGTADDVGERIRTADAARSAASGGADEPARGPGRPKLGVVAREVTLLPRHWDWLAEQPGGASIALRKLVEEARRANSGRDRLRQSQDCAYRYMSAIAGDLPGFEEAARALFAANEAAFRDSIASWPPDVRDHVLFLAFGTHGDTSS